VRASKFGILDLQYDRFILTDCVFHGKRVYKVCNELPSTFDQQNWMFNNLVGSLSCVTEMNAILIDGKFNTLLLLLFSFTVSSTEGLTTTCAAAFELS